MKPSKNCPSKDNCGAIPSSFSDGTFEISFNCKKLVVSESKNPVTEMVLEEEHTTSSEEHAVYVMSSEWGSRKPFIIDAIHNEIQSNSELIEESKAAGIEIFVEELKSFVFSQLCNTKLLDNLTNNQLDFVKAYIIAVYYITQENPPCSSYLIDITKLHHTHIDFIKDHFGVELPLFSQNWDGKLNLVKNGELAEMTTIINGDGSLEYYDLNHPLPKGEHKGNSLTISLNRIDEPEYVEYVADFMELLFKKKPSRYLAKKGKGIRLVLFGRALVEELISLGLVPGNKVKNEVSVLDWVKKIYPIRGLRGLIDTDGDFTVVKLDKSIAINFTNASKPLVEDFKSMCNSVDIETTNIRPDPRSEKKVFYVHIGRRDQVKKFIEIIKSEKWNYRRNYIGMDLIALKDPDIYKKISYDIKKAFPEADLIQYSKELEALLEKLCIDYGLDISDKAIDKTIADAFEFKEFPYRGGFASQWKVYYEQLGSFGAVRKYLKLYHNISPRKDTIQRHIKIYMTEKGEGYDFWFEKIKDANLRPIVFKKIREVLTITQFPVDLKIVIVKLIGQILVDENFSTDNSEIIQRIVNDYNIQLIRMQYLLGDSDYKTAITDYIFELIKLVRRIFQLGKKVSAYRLEKEFPFSRPTLKVIIDTIKLTFPEVFY